MSISKKFFLIIFITILSGCESVSYYRVKGYPTIGINKNFPKDDPVRIKLNGGLALVRAKTFNHYLHVQVIVEAKTKKLTYFSKKVDLKDLEQKKFLEYKPNETSITLHCKKIGKKDIKDTEKIEVEKNCQVVANYSFADPSWTVKSKELEFQDKGLKDSLKLIFVKLD